jgi:hypothetical protein
VPGADRLAKHVATQEAGGPRMRRRDIFSPDVRT